MLTPGAISTSSSSLTPRGRSSSGSRTSRGCTTCGPGSTSSSTRPRSSRGWWRRRDPSSAGLWRKAWSCMRQPEAEARRRVIWRSPRSASAKVSSPSLLHLQQAGEKALKALHYRRGARMVLGHSLAELLLDLLTDHPDLSDLPDAARQLDHYYIPTRYP